MNMKIEIELFGQLAIGRQAKQVLDVLQPLEVHQVVLRLGLDEEQIGLITIDGVQSETDDVLTRDSRLCFFPYMSGG